MGIQGYRNSPEPPAGVQSTAACSVTQSGNPSIKYMKTLWSRNHIAGYISQRKHHRGQKGMFITVLPKVVGRWTLHGYPQIGQSACKL